MHGKNVPMPIKVAATSESVTEDISMPGADNKGIFRFINRHFASSTRLNWEMTNSIVGGWNQPRAWGKYEASGLPATYPSWRRRSPAWSTAAPASPGGRRWAPGAPQRQPPAWWWSAPPWWRPGWWCATTWPPTWWLLRGRAAEQLWDHWLLGSNTTSYILLGAAHKPRDAVTSRGLWTALYRHERVRDYVSMSCLASAAKHLTFS